MKINTSYFYQIRNFKPNMIPISTAMSDPAWYKPPKGQEYYIDKRGIICGLRYEPLIVQPCGPLIQCPCQFHKVGNPYCSFLTEYRRALYEQVDKERTLNAFHTCAYKMANKYCFSKEPIIVLIVYETPDNPCSERKALQEFFNCEELRYPIV